MSECNRFETEGIDAILNGEALSEHFQTCSECIDAARAYGVLTAALNEHHQDASPPAGWQQQVMREIHAPKALVTPLDAPPWRARARWVAMAAGVVAAAVFAALVWRAPTQLTFESSIVSSGATLRSSDVAAPGDSLVIRWHGEWPADQRLLIRVYRDDRALAFECGGAAPRCEDGGVSQVSAALPSPGDFQYVIALSAEPWPGLGGGLDADVLALREGGASTVSLGKIITVR